MRGWRSGFALTEVSWRHTASTYNWIYIRIEFIRWTLQEFMTQRRRRLRREKSVCWPLGPDEEASRRRFSPWDSSSIKRRGSFFCFFLFRRRSHRLICRLRSLHDSKTWRRLGSSGQVVRFQRAPQTERDEEEICEGPAAGAWPMSLSSLCEDVARINLSLKLFPYSDQISVNHGLSVLNGSNHPDHSKNRATFEN